MGQQKLAVETRKVAKGASAIAGNRVLISTLATNTGGVPAMMSFMTACLEQRGYEPVLAYYEPYGMTPELSVPSYRIGTRTIGHLKRQARSGHEAHAIGAWLPELEFTHYVATRLWKEQIAQSDFHISVSGNALAATPYLQVGKRYLSWVATGWEEDRKDRIARDFSWPRKLLDKTINAPVLSRLERRILRGGTVLALSDHTRKVLDGIAGPGTTFGLLPMPVDTVTFHPDPGAIVKGRIGFSGRISDPRKNVELLLQAVSLLKGNGSDFTVELIGGELDASMVQVIEGLGLTGRVSAIPYLAKPQLAERLRTLDVFVVPSLQEGLCIAALEAMASGCPVVSTCCGGPEEFVRNDETGQLVRFDAAEMAAAIGRILDSPGLRSRLAAGARALVEKSYNFDAASHAFWQGFEAAFAKPGGKV